MSALLNIMCSDEPTHCDNCGEPLTRGSRYKVEYQMQSLPAGETINGRSYIAICAYGECLGRDEAPS